MDSKPATPQSEQSDKTKKYDRQLRLWGDHGQALLEAAHVCVCGPSASVDGCSSPGASGVLGAEVLRSLVLPGVGKITVLDDALVTHADLGNNLFVEEESLGQPRGEQLLQCLLEMNPDVRGSFVDQSVEDVLLTRPDLFHDFSVVVAVNLQEKPLLELSSILWRAKVPLLVVRSYGLIGYIRVQVEEQTIVESHPDNVLPDLWLLSPFPALEKHLSSVEWEALTDKEHSHVPYVAVLYKYLQQWIQEKGDPPKNYREKKQLGQMIREGMRLKNPSDYEENFEEAIKAVNTCLSAAGACECLQGLFDLLPSPLTPSTPPFWLVLAGIKAFVDSKQRLPVTGVVPDMTADSASYIRLQTIYRDQAKQDSEAVFRHALSACQEASPMAGGSTVREGCTPDTAGVSESLVRLMCRHAGSLSVLRTSSLAQEYGNKPALGASEVEVCDSEVVWYVLLRAVELFHTEFRCYPGHLPQHVEADIVNLKVCVTRLLAEWSANLVIKDDHIHEMCRYGAAQIHSVASFVGGCAAHEVIKLLTKQYVPLDNTLLYNAATATTTTLTL